MAGGPCPVRSYDGMAEPPDLPPLPPAEARCPACGAPVAFDPRAVAQGGRPAGADLEAALVDTLAMTVTEWDGHRLVRSRDGLSPLVADHDCPRCGAALLAVVATGEFQPARRVVVAEGLLARSG